MSWNIFGFLTIVHMGFILIKDLPTDSFGWLIVQIRVSIRFLESVSTLVLDSDRERTLIFRIAQILIITPIDFRSVVAGKSDVVFGLDDLKG